MDPILAELKLQQRAAWDAHDLETFDLYLKIEHEIGNLRAVGRAVASLYQHTSSEEAWEALYLALSDSGLLTAEDNQPEDLQAEQAPADPNARA